MREMLGKMTKNLSQVAQSPDWYLTRDLGSRKQWHYPHPIPRDCTIKVMLDTWDLCVSWHRVSQWHLPNFELHKMRKISWPGQRLLASLREFFSIELVNVQNCGVYSIFGKRRYGINIRNTLLARIGIYNVCRLRRYIIKSAFTRNSSQNITQ